MEKKRNDDLKITVSGFTSVGKSTIIYLLNEFLKQNGWNVELTESAVFDYGNEERYLDKLEKTI